jgi:glutaredoxin
MSTLIMYSIPGCGTCARAKREMAEEGVEFEERDIYTNSQWYEEAAKLGISVPIFIRDGQVEMGWKGDSGCPFQ